MVKCSFWASLILFLLYPKFVSKYLFMLRLLSFATSIKATESQILFFMFVSLSKSKQNERLKSWWPVNTSILWKLRFNHLYFIVDLTRLSYITMANLNNYSNKIIFHDFVKIYFENYIHAYKVRTLKKKLTSNIFPKIVRKTC